METMLAEKIKLIRLQQNNQNVLKCHIFSQKKNISVSTSVRKNVSENEPQNHCL